MPHQRPVSKALPQRTSFGRQRPMAQPLFSQRRAQSGRYLIDGESALIESGRVNKDVESVFMPANFLAAAITYFAF
jgi:hypothetical protein